MQVNIPSFTPSISSSRKSFREQNSEFKKNLMADLIKEDKKESFWSELFDTLFASYQSLSHKINLAHESSHLHREALKLKNLESTDLEVNIQNVTNKLGLISSEVKKYENKMKSMGEKCHNVKHEGDKIRTKINKEEVVLIEEQKHVEQIQRKINKLKGQTKELNRELISKEESQNHYFDICEENEKLLADYQIKQKEYSLAQLKIEKERHDEEKLRKKMKELERIMVSKEQSNRELGKRLLEMKRIQPEVRIQTKGLCLNEVNRTLQSMEMEYGRLQEQVLELNDSIGQVEEKCKRKQLSIEGLRRKRELLIDSESKQIYRHEVKASVKKKTNSKTPGPQYKVIESEEDENFTYPKVVNSYLEKHESRKNPSQVIEDHGENMQLSPSVQQIISKYHQIIEKGHE